MPARFNDLIRVLTALGCRVEQPSSGSHWKVYRNGKMYTVPAHNGGKSEISDKYLRGLCRSLELDLLDVRSKL